MGRLVENPEWLTREVLSIQQGLSNATPNAKTISIARSTGPSAELTSVSAGHRVGGAPRRNRTGDPILTMEPPGTAVRTAVSPARVRPWGQS